MNATRHIEHEDLALLAMELLSQEESTAFEQHLATCNECRQSLAEIRGELALYARTVDLQAPSARSRERLLNQVAKEKKIIPISSSDRSSRSSAHLGAATGSLFGSADAGRTDGSSPAIEGQHPRRSIAAQTLPWLGWAVAAGIGVAAGNLYHQRDALRSTITEQSVQMGHLTAEAASAREILDVMTDTSAMRVTLNRSQTAPVPQGRATYVPDKGALIFLASNMQPLQPSKTYELWIIPADGRDPVPAGTFTPDQHGNASIIMPPLPPGIPAKAFGITIEDQGGSQTPTLPIIMVGA